MKRIIGDRFGPTLAICILAGVCLGIFGVGECLAFRQQPGLNLGATSFLDGGPPAGPGFYYTQYIQYYHSDRFNNFNGDRLIPGLNEDLNVWSFVSQFIYQSNQDVFFGGKWGLNLMIPIVSTNLDTSLPIPFDDNGTGLGDIVIGPYLQWEPIMGSSGPLFMHRIEFDMFLPTGKYDADRLVNPGSNFFTFNPFWAATVFLTPKWTASMRLHYVWNAENDDPSLLDLPANNTRAGQAIHFNYATDYQVLPQLRLGINGYYLKQITSDEIDGRDIPNSREQVFAIGPGLLFHYSKDTHFFVNLYFESFAENRSEGIKLNLRWVQHF